MRASLIASYILFLGATVNEVNAYLPSSVPKRSSSSRFDRSTSTAQLYQHQHHRIKPDNDVGKTWRNFGMIAMACLSFTFGQPDALAAVDTMPPYIPSASSTSILLSSTTNVNEERVSSSSNTWLLPNGEVELTEPLIMLQSERLSEPKLLGYGGGGAVFALKQEYQEREFTEDQTKKSSKEKIVNREVAVKISWVASAKSVQKECQVLKLLEENGARNIERCLGMEEYPFDNRRAMIFLQPVVNDATASINEVDEAMQPKTVRSVIQTLVDLVTSNVVTTDVQALINKRTGEITFIDLTESTVMSKPPSFLDLAQASSFCSEIFSMIPENLLPLAYTTLQDELESGLHVFPDESLLNVLKSQIGS